MQHHFISPQVIGFGIGPTYQPHYNWDDRKKLHKTSKLVTWCTTNCKLQNNNIISPPPTWKKAEVQILLVVPDSGARRSWQYSGGARDDRCVIVVSRTKSVDVVASCAAQPKPKHHKQSRVSLGVHANFPVSHFFFFSFFACFIFFLLDLIFCVMCNCGFSCGCCAAPVQTFMEFYEGALLSSPDRKKFFQFDASTRISSI